MSSLNPVKKVGKQITEVLTKRLGMTKQAANLRAAELIDSVGIPDAEQQLTRFPMHLSGGMRQRVAIAIAMACEPKLLIADEPTTALDVTIQAQMLDLIRELQQKLGTAVMLITHDLGVVAETCDRVIVMYAGRKIEEASVERIFANPLHPYTRGLLTSVPRLQAGLSSSAEETGDRISTGKLNEIPGIVPSLTEKTSGCSFAPRCLRVIDRCRIDVPVLEETVPEHFVACFDPDGSMP